MNEGAQYAVLVHGQESSVEVKSPDVGRPYAELAVRFGGLTVLVCPAFTGFEAVTEEHVRFARELVEAAHEYLFEVAHAYRHDHEMDQDIVDGIGAA